MTHLIPYIRDASRQLVREFGFMDTTLAGTDLPPSSVHTIIEIGSGRATTKTSLCTSLNLSPPAVNQVLKSLLQTGEITSNQNQEEKDEESLLSLTTEGLKTLDKINTFAEKQVFEALAQTHYSSPAKILEGVKIYADALRDQRLGHQQPLSQKKQLPPNITISRGYHPSLLGRTIDMHMSYYSRTVGFGRLFEAQLATGLGDLLTRLGDARNEAWVAILDREDEKTQIKKEIVGTLYIEDVGDNQAHLRAFIVQGGLRGAGIGRRMLEEGVRFVDEMGFKEVHLWTFKGLDAARHLYESCRFVLVDEGVSDKWGKEVLVQHFRRRCGGGAEARAE